MSIVAGTDPATVVIDGTDRTGTTVRRRWPAVLAVLAGTALICAHASLYGHWIVDDAAITFDYARNVALHHGPVLQPGAPPVEGYSDTSWLVLLVAGRWLGLFDHGAILGVPDYVLYPKLLAVVWCAATLVAFHRIASALVARPWLVTLCAGVVLACVPSYVIWCFSGLENSLYAFLVTAIAAVTVRAVRDDRLRGYRPAVIAGSLAALAALTRPDGMIYAASFPLAALLLVNRAAIRSTVAVVAASLASFAVPFGGFLLWRHAEFGRWVANTAAAKKQVVGPGGQTVSEFTKIAGLVAYIGVIGALIALLLIGAAVGRPSPFRRGLVGVLVPLALAVAAFGVLQSDWMGQYRFATPVWALASIVVTLCAYHVLTTAGLRMRVVCGLGIALALSTSLAMLRQDVTDFRAGPTVPLCHVADSAGRMVNQLADEANLPDTAVFVGPDLGGASLTTRLRIVDLAGLADVRIAGYREAGDRRGLAAYVLGTVRPAFLSAVGPWRLTGLDPRLRSDYYLLDTTDPANGGLYVRRDVARTPALLHRLRATYRSDTTLLTRYVRAPLSACGSTLASGQATLSH